MPFQAKPVAHGDAAIITKRGAQKKSPESRTELWVDAAVTGRYWGRTLRDILNYNTSEILVVYAPWALRSSRLEQSADKYIYTGFQAGLSAGKISGKEQIIILHPTVYPPVMNLANGQHPKIVVCLLPIDVSAYNLSWRLWAAENGAKVIYSPQDSIRIDLNQNYGFWRPLLLNE